MINNLIIGLDVGGTKISGVVFNGKKVFRSLEIKTPNDIEGYKKAIVQIVKDLSVNYKILSIGVAHKGVLNYKTGKFVEGSLGNLKFLSKLNALSFFNSLGFSQVKIGNDSQAFALAESFLGYGKKYKNFIVLTLGTDIGGGIVVNGKLYTGQNGSAAHFAHILADFKNTAGYYYGLAKKNIPEFSKLDSIITLLLVNFINIFDPEAVIFGGYVANKYSKNFLAEAVTKAKNYVLNRNNFPKILVSKIKHAGAIGATYLTKV